MTKDLKITHSQWIFKNIIFCDNRIPSSSDGQPASVKIDTEINIKLCSTTTLPIELPETVTSFWELIDQCGEKWMWGFFTQSKHLDLFGKTLVCI